jgi:hypothetical protein
MIKVAQGFNAKTVAAFVALGISDAASMIGDSGCDDHDCRPMNAVEPAH